MSACFAEPQPQPVSPVEPLVVTTSYPARWLVEQLSPAGARLEHLAPPGEDPQTWQPSGELVARMGQASLVVANGRAYESWLETVSLPQGRLVLSAQEVKPIKLLGNTHSHGSNGEHSHAGLDPHTWMDPQSYLIQARAVHAGLSRVYSQQRGVLDQKLHTLLAGLEALDQQNARLLESLPTAKYAANHPAYNYFFRRYAMEVRSFDISPGKPPAPEAVAEIQAWASGELPAVMLWESEPVDAIKTALPGLHHLVVDPIEQPAAGSYDYFTQARANLAVFTALGEGMKRGTPPSGAQQGLSSQ
jgi:zinc transport system substrate-binding protein